MIRHLAVSVEHRRVTDRQTDSHTTVEYTVLAWHSTVKAKALIHPTIDGQLYK